MVKVAGFELRLYQVLALFISPLLFWIGLILIESVFHVLETVLHAGTDTTGFAYLVHWLLVLAALGAFCALVWVAYNFVKNKGWGLFD